MILIHSTKQDAKLRIVHFVQTQTDEEIVIAQTIEEIVDVFRQNHPNTVFLYMPGRPGTARDIQTHVRRVFPHARVRILPLVDGTNPAVDSWHSVVTKALRPREIARAQRKESAIVKIIIAAEDAELIKEVVEKQGHAVVAETNDTAHLFDLILRHTPDFVFLEKTKQTAHELERLESVFQRVRFVSLGYERGTTWTKSVRHALRNGRIRSPWHPETPDQRQIIFDLRYYGLSSPTKLMRPAVTEKSEDTAAVEALRLTWMAATNPINSSRSSIA